MINKLKLKSEFSKNVLTLMTGTTIAQAIPIAISPILTRIYTPEDFGFFALFISITSLLALIATARYELAVVLPKKESEAINIVILSTIITTTLSLITLFIMIFYNESITQLLGNDEISNWLYFVPLSLFFLGLYQTFNYWNTRNKNYKLIASNKVTQSSTTAIANLTFGFSKIGLNGLVISTIISQAVATLLLARKLFISHGNIYKRTNKLTIFALMKRYKKMPLLNMPNAFVDGLRVSGINIIIANGFSTTVLGHFSLAWRMVQTPMALIGSSLTQVLYVKIAKAKKEELFFILRNFIIKSLLMALIPFAILYFYSIEIFTFIFGNNWKTAGEVSTILVPWLYLNFVTSPISTVFIVLNKQEVMFIFSLLYMAIPLSILFIFKEMAFLEVLNYVAYSMTSLLIVFIVLVLFYTKKEVDS